MNAPSLTPIFNEDGWNLRRDTVTIALLRDLLMREGAISDHVADPVFLPGLRSFGGGCHFRARRRDGGGEVAVKLGAYANEREWITAVQVWDPGLMPVPMAMGAHLGPYRLGWLVSEWLPFGPLGPVWGGEEFRLLIDAAVRFHAIADTNASGHRQGAVAALPIAELTQDKVAAWLDHPQPPLPIPELRRNLPADWLWLHEHVPASVCHGDLHLANALARAAPPAGPAVLIDVQPIRQPWILEAAYLQIFQTDPVRPGSHDLIPAMAAARARRGLSVGDDLRQASTISLAWMAMRAWSGPGSDRGDGHWRASLARHLG